MNMGSSSRVVGSMSLSGQSVTRKSSGEGLQFPAGLRVLVVDDDPTCLTILEKMLETCRYEVTKTNRAEVALRLLRENRNGFDVVISDVHMPDMDGFKLLEHVGLEMDLPVIMMSADDSRSVVMKGVTHGACDYLIKPIRIEALKNIWQHVVRKKKNWKELEQSGSWDEGEQQRQDEAVSSPASEGGWKSSKRKGEEEDTEGDDTAALKKPRVVWSVDLHQQFVAAVNQLGVEKAVPKKILELMNVPGLTRENVASHLQKYRLYLRRVSGASQNQGGLNNSFMPQDSGFAAMSSLGGLDLQALAATGQLSAQTLAAYSRMPPTTVKPGMSMPFVDQRNVFSFENSKLRYGDGQQPQLGNVGKQVNLLHGVPTITEPKQIGGLNQSGQTLGGINMHASSSSSHQSNSLLMPMMPQQQSRGLILNESQVPRVQSSMGGPPMQSNGSGSGVLSRNGMAYNPVSQAAPPLVDFSVNQISELPGSGFPLGSTPGITSITSKGFNNQEEVSSNIKGTRGYAPNYDVFSELQQHKSQDWQFQNPGMTFASSSAHHGTPGQSSVNVSPSVLLNQSYVHNQTNEHNGNSLTGKQPMFSGGLENQQMGKMHPNQNFNVNSLTGKQMFSGGLENQQMGMMHANQNLNGNSLAGKQMFSGGLENQQMGTMNHNQILNGPPLVGNPMRVKTEVINPGANLFSEHYGQEDLMSALLKQQQEGMASGEFDFDGYSLDNIPV